MEKMVKEMLSSGLIKQVKVHSHLRYYWLESMMELGNFVSIIGD